MNIRNLSIFPLLALVACNQPKPAETATPAAEIVGTWRLVSNIVITKGDTAVNFPVKGKDNEMLKMYNDTHFAFFMHDKGKGKVASPTYDTGAGTYKLSGTDYTEHLAFCNYRDWENRDFNFKLTTKNDTLVQKGIEKIDSLKIDHEIIETYVRVK